MAQPTPPTRDDAAVPQVEREQPRLPRPPSPTNWWRVATIGAIAVLLAFGLGVVVWLLARPIALLLAAIVIATALLPLVEWLARWLPRTLAIGIVYLAVLLIFAGIGWIIVPPLIEQMRTLVENGPALLERAGAWLDRRERIDSRTVFAALESRASELAGALVAAPLLLVSSITEFVLVLTMSAYWLIAMPAIGRFCLSLFPTRQRRQAAEVLGEMGQTMGGFVRGTLIDGAIVAILVYLGLTLIGVEYTLVLALVAGLGELVPVVGPFLAGVPAVAIALTDSPGQALIVLIFYLVLQQVESNLLLPYIMRTQSEIPPLLTLFALLAGATLGGLLGALIAIPLSGTARVFVVRVVAPLVRRWSGATTEVDGPWGATP